MPHIRVPVVCPHCSVETLAPLPIATAAAALIEHSPIVLRAPCHTWTASAIEVEQIREYLAIPEIAAPVIHDEPHA